MDVLLSDSAPATALVNHIVHAPNAFVLMGIPISSAPLAEIIRTRYISIARRIHPDKCPDDERATSAMQMLKNAKDSLEDVMKLPGITNVSLISPHSF
jgi:hypothetical protein